MVEAIHDNGDYVVEWDGAKLHRYRCKKCGQKGRWYRDGNLADVYGENHQDNKHGGGW